MKTFQYKIYTPEIKKGLFKNKASNDISEKLTQLGQEGWELVNVVPIQGTSVKSYGGATVAFEYYFKKESTN